MKIKFNKFGVCLAFFMIIVYTFYCVFTGNFPPAEMTFCWYGAWTVELILLMKIHKNGKKQTILEKLEPYINEDNIEQIVEQKLGVELKKNDR